MQTHVLKYYDQGIYTFTFEGLTAETNDKGKVVKKAHGFPNWKSINRNNSMEYAYNHHRAIAVMTGKISNITCLDFDVKEEYERLVAEHPELNNFYTVQTNKGFHIYFKYNENIKTTTNGMNSYNGVDIRNDAAILYAPPTKYKIKNTGVIVEYKLIGGEILECPEYIINDLKQNNVMLPPPPPPQPPPRPMPTPTPTPKLTPATTSSPTSTPSPLTDDQMKNNSLKELEKLKIMAQCYNKERISNYTTYFNFTMAIKNCFGDSGKETWDEICSRGDNYDSNKNNEQ